MSVVQISVIVASILTGEWKWCQERAYVRGGGGGWLHGDGVPVWLLWAAVIWQEGRKEGRKSGSSRWQAVVYSECAAADRQAGSGERCYREFV